MKRIRLAVAALATFALTLVALSAPASAQDARIHLIHGIPDTDVDVAAGGVNVFENFSFGDTEDLSGLAGSTLEDLTVKLAGTDTAAIEAGNVTLPTDGNTTIIAHLDASGTPTISVFKNDVSQLGAGEGRLVVRHVAAAPEVDIRADGAVAFAAVPNGAEGSVDLPIGTVSADVVPTGETSPVVIGPADLPINDGESLIVYAVGSLSDNSLTVLTESITGLHTPPNAVNTGTSPVGNGNDLALVGAALLGAVVLVGGGRLVRATARV